LVIYLGYLFILLGAVFLVTPLLYIELGRPKDFIRAGLNFIIGIVLIIKSKVLQNSYSAIYLLLTLLVFIFALEIFSYRWNQLTDLEKNKLATLEELKKNILKIFEAISLAFSKFAGNFNLFKIFRNNQKSNEKKWVRDNKNDNIET